MTPPGTLAKAAAINRRIYCGMGSCFGRALSSFKADLAVVRKLLAVVQKLLAAPHAWKEDAPVLHLWLPRCDAWQSLAWFTVGLHLLHTGLELGSVSALSVGLDVMVSSGLSSRWTKEPFQSCGEQGTT